jgi:hypothetical protein
VLTREEGDRRGAEKDGGERDLSEVGQGGRGGRGGFGKDEFRTAGGEGSELCIRRSSVIHNNSREKRTKQTWQKSEESQIEELSVAHVQLLEL